MHEAYECEDTHSASSLAPSPKACPTPDVHHVEPSRSVENMTSPTCPTRASLMFIYVQSAIAELISAVASSDPRCR